MTVVFSCVLKTARVVPVFKKESKITSQQYNLQFGFRQQYSASHALINITENISKALYDGNISCGVVVNLQKAFDTVDHQILLVKLNFYEIGGAINDWFKYSLSNRKQYVSIKEYESGLAAIICSVPHGSVLRPLLFITIYK